MKIDVQEILARVRSALEDAGPTPWLLAYDVMGIQEYVSANSRPLCLRGASGLLKEFDKGRRLPGYIFAGGGRGLMLASSESEAKERALGLKTAFRELTLTGSLAAAYVPFDPDPARAKGCLRWLQLKLDNDKEGLEPLRMPLPSGREDECQGCGAWFGKTEKRIGDTVERLCRRCCLTLELGREDGLATEKKNLSVNEYAVQGFVAVVSADGNHMGQLFESLDTLGRVALVSEAVRVIFEESHESARGNLKRDTLSPVAGGDDLRLVLAPTDLPNYLERLMRGIEERTSEAAALLEEHLTEEQTGMLRLLGVGIGAVIGDSHYPIAQMLECAHRLEDSAKTLARWKTVADGQEKGARFSLDFAFLTTPDFEIQIPRPEPKRPGARPLRIDGQHWPTFLKQARALANVRNAQRAVLAEEGQLSRAEFFNLLRYQVARSREWQGFYETLEQDWTQAKVVEAYCPDRGMLDFVRLLELEPSDRRSA